MVTIDNMRQVAMSLPRTEEHLVRGRVKFRVGKIVYVAFSRDEKTLGFAVPKEWRAALIEAEPDKFHMPEPADVRYNWVCVRRDAIDQAEMRKLVTEAWRMVVPKGVARPLRRQRFEAMKLYGGHPMWPRPMGTQLYGTRPALVSRAAGFGSHGQRTGSSKPLAT